MSNHAEIGEMTVQFVAENDEAKRELEEFRKQLKDFDHLKAVTDDFSFEEFDQRLLESHE